jgi:hypothetical protein
MWKEAVVVVLQALSRQLAGETEKNYDLRNSDYDLDVRSTGGKKLRGMKKEPGMKRQAETDTKTGKRKKYIVSGRKVFTGAVCKFVGSSPCTCNV